MKNTILLAVLFLCSTSLWAQKKSKFNTIDKNTSKHEIQWNGSISYGNTIFIGDLNHFSSERYLPNVALAVKFNKEFSPKHALQFGIITGKNSGENNPTDNNIPLKNFRSQYTQANLAYRRALTNTGIQIPQLHLVAGAGYYYADAQLTHTLDDNTTEFSDDVWSLVFPVGLELSYYIQEEWGAVLSLTNNLFGRDHIDLLESSSNGLDHQIIINLGLCYKFNE